MIKYIVIFTLIALSSCWSTRNVFFNDKGFQREKVYYDYENDEYDSSLLIKRSDTNQVILSFFGTYNDTVVLYVDNKERASWNINKSEGSPTSSEYTGIDVGILFNNSMSNIIYVKLKRKKKYASITINKSYPICTLYRTGDAWHIGFRKSKMVIK